MLEPTPSNGNTNENESEIAQQVEREMSQTRSSMMPLIAFGTVLVASLYVGILAIAKAQRVEAARPAPRWVNWTYSLEDAQARAAKTQQKIFIDFYTDWCPSCKAMDAHVYTKPEVLHESQNAIMVKINADGRQDLAKRYNIRVLPTLVWTDVSGAEVARHDGSAPAPEVAALMAQNR